MISRIFAEFANQNAFPANFPKKAAKNRANLKGVGRTRIVMWKYSERHGEDYQTGIPENV